MTSSLGFAEQVPTSASSHSSGCLSCHQESRLEDFLSACSSQTLHPLRLRHSLISVYFLRSFEWKVASVQMLALGKLPAGYLVSLLIAFGKDLPATQERKMANVQDNLNDLLDVGVNVASWK